MAQLYDASSNANYTVWSTVHTALEVSINFNTKALEGKALLTMKCMAASSEITLDTSHLTIKSVLVDATPSKYELKSRKEPLGQALVIRLPSAAASEEERLLEIDYSTTDSCTALQWLEPAQTAGTKPYMFSQNQAIHARSMFPCQDTPIIKSSFLFRLTSPHVVVATGNYKGSTASHHGQLMYEYAQPIPIPSYLAA